MGGGKTSKGSSTVSIPPEVMARYNAVNQRAEEAASQPFQRYNGQFVAGLTDTQQQGISNVSQAANQAQPYYDAATGQLQQAYQQGQNQLAGAYTPLAQAAQVGQGYGNAAQQYYAGAAGQAQPYYQAATAGLGQGLDYAQQLQNAALGQAFGAQGAAAPLQNYGMQAIMGAAGGASPANAAAMQMGLGAARQSQPFMQQAASGTQAALAAGSPYQGMATQAALAGSQAVNADQFSNEAVGKYMSPYLSNVVEQTMKAQEKQNAAQRSALNTEAIKAGAFGGDRAGIAQANLAYQQNMANQQTIANLLQGGYGQALGAFQQQQGVNLAAEQANRAAKQGLAQQALAIGQQGYGQQLGAAGQMANIGQALFGQGIQGAQTVSGLGQTQYGQQLGAGQAAGALGQQLYGQGMTNAQFAANLGQQGFQQQLANAQQQQAIGQGLSNLQFQTGQAMQGLGQQQYAQGLGLSQQQAALAQAGYGMGAGTAQAMAGLGAGAQQAALQGAQAQIGAGTLEQQTQQADLTAKYQQFLQERGFPYQQAQFLANIAMGTGALSGSTTSTVSPAGFFSDKRLKEDAEKIGKTNDGQPIYRFRYKGDPRYQIGLMAQDVEKEHPEAVGKHDGFLTVDYKVATDDAVKHRAQGGLVPNWMGGVVDEPGHYAYGGLIPREGYAAGSTVADSDFMKSILASQQQAFGPIVGGNIYGGAGAGTPGGKEGYVPKASLPTPKLMTASPVNMNQPSGLSQASNVGKSIAETYKMGKEAYKEGRDLLGFNDKKPAPGGTTTTTTKPGSTPPATNQTAAATTPKADQPSANAKPISYESEKEGYFIPPGKSEEPAAGLMPAKESESDILVREVQPEDIFFAAGGVVPRQGYAGLGKVVDPYETQDPSKGVNAYIEDATESQEDTSDDKIAGVDKSGGGKGRSGMDGVKDIAGAVGTAGTIIKGISTLASLLPFSDERLKDNIEKVGKLNDGQNVYRYDFGNGRTQLGLLAQEVLKHKPEAVGKRDGYLTVNYDKATEGAIKRAMGGMARHGYATDGEVEPEHPVYELLRQKEGFLESPRYDVNAMRGGYGTDTFTTPEGKVIPVTAETRFTKEDADRDLRRRVPEFQQGIVGKVGEDTWKSLNPNAQAALTSVAYNYGSLPNSVVRAVQSGDTAQIAEAVNALGSHNEGVNAKRRAHEASLINPEGNYAVSSAPSRSGQRDERADLPSEKAEPVQYSGEGSDASAGFKIPGGEKFWIPALSMVGSMLASKNPTLGGAIGEGIVGGVAGYQVQQKMAADLAKGVLDIVKDRFNVTTDQKTGQTRYFNKSTGELLSPPQFKQAVAGIANGLGVDPAVLGIVSPGQQVGGYSIPGGGGERLPSTPSGGGQTAATTTQPSTTEGQPAAGGEGARPGTTEQQPVDLTRMNQTQLVDYAQKNPKAFAGLQGDRDPNKMNAQIDDLKQRELNATNQGNTAEATRLAAERADLQKRKDQYLNEAVDLQYKQNVSLQDAQTKSYNEYLTEAQKRNVAYVQAKQGLKRLADIYASYEPNRAEELKTQVTNFLSGIPGFDIFNREYQNASFDEAMKIALTQAFKIVDENGLTRAPGAAMANSVKTVPAPTLSAGAAYGLIGKAIGDLDYWNNVDKRFMDQPRGSSPTEFLLKYKDKYKDETPEKYIRQAFENEVRPGPGVNRDTVESLRKSYGFERVAGSETGGGNAPRQQQPADNLPTVASPADAARLPSGTRFRDPNGVIRMVP